MAMGMTYPPGSTMHCRPPDWRCLSLTWTWKSSIWNGERMELPRPWYAPWCIIMMTGPAWERTTAPAVTMGMSFIRCSLMPEMSTLRWVCAITRTSLPNTNPLAPRSTRARPRSLRSWRSAWNSRAKAALIVSTPTSQHRNPKTFQNPAHRMLHSEPKISSVDPSLALPGSRFSSN